MARIAGYRVTAGFALGFVAFILARPTARSLLAGGAVALAGEVVRIWAAGHLEKGREVTASGPYRWSRHPLYVGSALLGAGLAVASNSLAVALLVAGYLAVTLTAAIRTEERWLRGRFGPRYDAYARGRVEAARRFSLERALVQNREYRAVAGIAVAMALLAVKRGIG
jgi:protein-S-isoprenylcysteine O-methyltransferase Ste14